MRSLVPFVAIFALACSEKPSDLRDWRPSDHDHTTNPGDDQVQGGPDAGTAPELAAHGLNELAIVAWQQNCVRCHGRLGRGDGPQGMALHATDFSNTAWQAAVTDEQILKTIREGKGAMPPFPLPDSTLKPLVQLVRLFGRAGMAEPNASAAPSGAPGRAPSAPSARALPPGHPLPSGHPSVSDAPAPDKTALPPGHPPVPGEAAPEKPGLPPGHPPLPAGHPPVSAPPLGAEPAPAP